jgi:hypothetical protein
VFLIPASTLSLLAKDSRGFISPSRQMPFITRISDFKIIPQLIFFNNATFACYLDMPRPFRQRRKVNHTRNLPRKLLKFSQPLPSSWRMSTHLNIISTLNFTTNWAMFFPDSSPTSLHTNWGTALSSLLHLFTPTGAPSFPHSYISSQQVEHLSSLSSQQMGQYSILAPLLHHFTRNSAPFFHVLSIP